ncbi:MAG: phospholipid carrier-dependent glycosyltransferase, partial [Acidobacteria bacterium]|nr:phospholipid carrier-dependent glycosyltransferase [Acidobacteriota bacterium]
MPLTIVVILAAVPSFLAFAAGGDLPILADGALHTQLVEQIAGVGRDTPAVSSYPPLYHMIGAPFYLLGGLTGLKLLSPIAIGLASVFIFLIVTKLTGQVVLAFAAQALMAFSPVLVWYSGLILMEPLVVATMLFGLYAL